MVMKRNDKNKLPQANKLFTDREEPRKVFWNTYQILKENIENSQESEIKVITYYGIGGIGKSSLLKQIKAELQERIDKPIYLSIDFEENTDMLSILIKIRNLLQNAYRFDFPIFDLAYYAYMQKQGHIVKKEEIENFMSRSPILDSILDITSVLPFPGVGTLIGILKGLDNLSAGIRNKLDIGKHEFNEIKNDEPNMLIKNMPYYLARDIESNLDKQTEPLVIFLDTYEILVNELANIGNPLDKDKWLRHEDKGLIVNIPNTIWVVAGRDKLKWENINGDWEGTLDQHLLGSLSDVDAGAFLYEAGISEQVLIKEIYQLTGGVPLYLDICVDRYHSLIEKGITPQIKDIGSNPYELISLFVKYMDDSKKALVYLLSCLEDWTEHLLQNLVQVFLPSLPFTTIVNIKNYSFVMTEDDITYKMHQLIRNIVYSDSDKNVSTKVNLYMKEYYQKILIDDSTNVSEYGNTLKKYVSYSLRWDFETEDDFVNFYRTSFMSFNENLMKSYQFNESLYIVEQLIEYTTDKFGMCLGTAYCLLSYAIAQYFAGNYHEALKNGSSAYDQFKLSLGNLHLDTIKAMQILIIAYRKTGQYQLSLSLSQELYNFKEQINVLDNSSTINELINLAISYRKTGSFKEAIKISEKVVSYRTNELGEEHPSTISALSSLANAYRQSGDNISACQLSEKVVKLRTRIYGENHPSTLAAMGSLAHSYRLVEKFDLATELSEKVVKVRCETLGEEHPLALSAMNNLANSYRKVGRYEEALLYAEKVVKFRTNILGENHPSTIGALSNLATSYRMLGQFEMALSNAIKVYKWRYEKYGESHPATLRAMNNLANSYKKMDRNDEAQLLLESLITIAHYTYGSKHPSTLAAEHNRRHEELIDIDEEDSEDSAEESFELLLY